MDIVEQLFEEAQDDPESIYWVAAQELAELRAFKAACEGLITAAGEVMRKKAIHEANYFLRTDGLYIANAIRALPNVTLEDLQK